MYNIIILNHFYGHPALEDECSNKQRYAKLLKLIDIVHKDNTIFLENDTWKKDRKLADIKDISLIRGQKWIEYNDEQSIDEILQNIYKIYNIEINSNNSYIILGGTNTAGCLLRTAKIAAKNWLRKNYDVQFCLSICTDYEMDALSTVDKNQMATAILYTFLKDSNYIEKTDVVYDPRELKTYKIG